MKQSFISTSSKAIRAAGACLLALAVLVVAAPSQASTAGTAANTIIRNTVTVKYNDTANHPMPDQVQFMDIHVDLVAATPTLNAPADQIVSSGTAAVYNYTIYSNANGPDTYNLTKAITESAGITSATSTATFSSTPISLGATTIAAPVTIAAGVPTAISVPNDLANDGKVNGISGGSVVINGLVYAVNSVSDNGGSATGTSTITVTGPASGLLPVGTVIGEQKTFTLTVTNGTVTVAADQTVTVDISARDSGSLAAVATDQTITTVHVANLTVLKEVSKDGGATFTTTTPTVAPGTVLVYRITVTNGGTSDATNVVITDPQPLYTTYQTGAKRATGIATTYTLAPTTLTDLPNSNDDGFDFGSTTSNTATYSVGIVSPGAANAVQLFLQYKIM